MGIKQVFFLIILLCGLLGGCVTEHDLRIDDTVTLSFELARKACLDGIGLNTDWNVDTARLKILPDGTVQYLDCTLHSAARQEYNQRVIDLGDMRYETVRAIARSLSAQGLNPPAESIRDLIR